MGQIAVANKPLNNQWTFIDNLGKFQIFKNQNNQLAEKHIVRTDPKIDQADYITAYHQRYLPNKPIVNAYDAQFQQKSQSMCQNSSLMTVYTQYIPHRLSDVKMLNHGQGIYVLSEALAGFSELFGRVGPFPINEDLIGFNQQGEVKVWYNPNFADNSVDNDRIILMSTVNPYDFDRKFSQNQQHDMVEDTINAVARYTNFNPQFLQQAQELKKLGFGQARRMLANEIARKAYYVPDHLLLSDKNGIINKSGVQLKHRHVVNPNKPRKGQSYPYFIQGQQSNQQTHYLQGHPPYPSYQYDNASQSSEGIELRNQGYYNSNGQNYRVIATKQFQGDNINQQQIIDQIMRNKDTSNLQLQQQQPQYQNVTNNPNYASVKSNIYANQVHYEHHPEQRGGYVRRQPKYQEGHIVLNDSSHYSRSMQQHTVNQPYHPPQPIQQQDNVRVFSMGENRRLQEENRHTQQINQSLPQFGSGVQPPQTFVESHYQPQQRVVLNDPIVAPVYSTRYTIQAPTQSVIPSRTDLNLQTQSMVRQPILQQNIGHRHRIFDQVPVPHQSLVREEPQLPQRVF